jgi:hypothetical protein
MSPSPLPRVPVSLRPRVSLSVVSPAFWLLPSAYCSLASGRNTVPQNCLRVTICFLVVSQSKLRGAQSRSFQTDLGKNPVPGLRYCDSHDSKICVRDAMIGGS